MKIFIIIWNLVKMTDLPLNLQYIQIKFTDVTLSIQVSVNSDHCLLISVTKRQGDKVGSVYKTTYKTYFLLIKQQLIFIFELGCLIYPIEI